MFERFTDRARRVIVLAQAQARSHDNERVLPEHLLLGLLDEDEGVAIRALHGVGADLAGLRLHLEAAIGTGDRPADAGRVPFAQSAKDMLEFALREAIQLGHNYIGTEHILLGLLRDRTTATAQLLLDAGAGPGPLRFEIVHLLRGYAATAADSGVPASWQRGSVLRPGAVTAQLKAIDARLARIEHHLGIDDAGAATAPGPDEPAGEAPGS